MFDKSVIILVVSREILEGSVVDRNAAFIANRIDDIGYRVRTIQVCDRVEAEMVATMSWALQQKPTFVLVTGGMGPNWDDNTRGCLAKAAGIELEENEQAREYVQNAYRRLFAKQVVSHPDMTDARLGMAMLPIGAKCYENTVGSAPAVQLDVGETLASTVEMLRRTISSKVKLHCEIEEGEMLAPFGAAKFQQVVANLVINAVDAMGGNGNIHIAARRRR